MGANEWLEIDKTLGYAELVLVPASLVYLVWALLRRHRRRTIRALLVAGLLAITVAQPFGVEGVPISPQEFAAGNPEPVDPESVQSVDVLGLGLFRFRPYTREIFYFDGQGGLPIAWLKVRSWVWPGLLANASKVERLCGNTLQPCWTPRDQPQNRFGRASNLELVQADGEWRYRILTRDGSPPRYPGNSSEPYRYNGYYRLAVGLVSFAGLVYWFVAGGIGVVLLLRLRDERSRERPILP